MKNNILTDNDDNILGCTFYHNNLASKISNNLDTLNTISDLDVLLLDNKKQAKKVAKLKKLMDEAAKLADEIASTYNDAKCQRAYEMRKKYND